MERYGIPKGAIWQASARYNDKVMTEDEVEAFYERAALGAPKPQTGFRDSRHETWNTVVHMPNDNAARPAIPPALTKQRVALPSTSVQGIPFENAFSNAPAGSFVFGSDSTNSLPATQFSFHIKPSGGAHEHVFCQACQAVIAKARAIQWAQPQGARGGSSIYVDQNCSHGKADQPRTCDCFPLHYETFAQLCQSALKGCHLCSLLASPDPSKIRNPPMECPNSYMLGVYGLHSYDGPGHIVVQVMGYERKMLKLSYDSPKSKLQGSLSCKRTDTVDIFTLSKAWLRQCSVFHKSCRHGQDLDNFIPTRLVKVEASEGTLSRVKLCITKDQDFPKAPYLALSHCWGNANITQLEMASVDSFQENIPLGSLPQNFTDAAIITSRLGFKYLWIDSLCIIQDSRADKAREIPTMGSVYGTAELTIAAMAAKDSNGGCFVTRNPLELVPALLRDGDSSKRNQVWVGAQGRRDPNAQGPLRPPLHQRGWVVQERALAPRTLYLGSDMVYWECVEGTASEMFPQMSREVQNSSGLDSATAQRIGLKSTLHTIRKIAMDGGGWKDWETFWWKLVKEYTASKLTENSDKWFAISALAMQVEKDTQSTLYHGLWECNLFEEVLWKCPQPGQRIDVAQLDAPSWSWLSVDGAVHEQRFNYNNAFDQVATVTKPLGARAAADGLGRSNQLLVRGYLHRVSWSEVRDRGGLPRFFLRLQDGHDRVFRTEKSTCQWNPDAAVDESWELSILPLVLSNCGDLEGYGLVVRPSDATNVSWVRVGVFRLDSIREAKGVPGQVFGGEEETFTLV